jgi:pimeloyl-ACP methyl ester carboxylesterase
LLGLHGGPGSTHHNLEALEALAGRRRVIFYDQLVLRGAAGGIHDPG